MVRSPPAHPPPFAPLPTHIPRSFAQQPVKSRRVWVRLTTGSSGSGIAPERALNLGSGIALYQVSLPAPGDVATLRRAVWAWSGQTFLGLVATDLRVSIRGHVLDDNVPIDGHGAERDAPFDVHLAAERTAEQVRFVWPAPSPSARTPAFSWPTATAPQPDLQSAPRDSRVCSPLTNCHAPHGRRSRSGSRPRCGSPARRLRESQQMDSASRGGCRLAARQTVRASLFSRPPRRRGGAGSMASCSTPATCCGNLARARATFQFTIRCTKSSLTDGAWS